MLDAQTPTAGFEWQKMIRSGATFEPGKICEAIGIDRGLFHSWLARRVVPWQSRGKGVSRRFTLDEVLNIAAIAEMVQAGVAVGAASALVCRSDTQAAFRQAAAEGWTGLIFAVVAEESGAARIYLTCRRAIAADIVRGLDRPFLSLLFLDTLLERLCDRLVDVLEHANA